MTLSLLAAGPVIATYQGGITDDQAQDWSLALLWSQAVAAKTAAQGTAGWFTALTAEMGRIAWIATDAGTSAYAASGGAMAAGTAAEALTAGFLPPDQADSVTALFRAIGSGTPPAGLDSFLTTLWNSIGQSGSGTAFAVSPLEQTAGGQLTTTLSLLSFAASRSDWQSFFVSRVTSAADLQCRHLRLTLNADLWSALRGPIAAKLGQAALASVLRLDI
jgi:hypothetical protein